MTFRTRLFFVVVVELCLGSISLGADHTVWSDLAPEIHGFLEGRAGYRLQNDLYEKDMSIMESRYQFDLLSLPDWGAIAVKGDVYGDGVTERGEFDLREANVAFTPLDVLDVKVGRQILTWGKGDLVFINDLFPKDWQSFFIGRDTEYLKAPSNAVKVGLYTDGVNWEVVYTPRFDQDRLITGERLSYWNGPAQQIAGQNAIVSMNRPRRWFQDEEIATRIYKQIHGYDLALYGYWGYWKSPAGFNAAQTIAQYPSLDVYGASAQGSLGRGIVSGEIGYYDSKDDKNGSNGLINNSEMRYLLGYTQEIGRDFTAGLQYYVEQMLRYQSYMAGIPAGNPHRDEFRHLVTLRLTKLLMNQNLQCSFFTYYSPSDEDAYFRPNLHYKVNDQTALEVGGNIFTGDKAHTFFGQFEDNSNVYASVRYSF